MADTRNSRGNAEFFDLPIEAFPIQLWALDAQTSELRWHAEITGPGHLKVPSRHEINEGRLVSVVARTADGRSTVAEP
jgi:hypothetical protein